MCDHGQGNAKGQHNCRNDTFEAKTICHHTQQCSASRGGRQSHATAINHERIKIISDVINEAVTQLNAKMGGNGFDGTAKFVIEDEGAIIIDQTGARAADDDADVTLTASADVFKAILDDELNPTTAFMTGKLSVDGDMGMAMKLTSVLG